MSLRIIELNDSAVRVFGTDGLIASSPGFALVDAKGLQLGEVAERQARLRPTQSFNKFWQQLSLEPLANAIGGVRHFADLAYAHLLHLTELGKLENEVLFAVPGNFTSHQLAILLGLAKQCPFKTSGVIDSALAGTIGKAREEAMVYVDLHLHQALLTRLSLRDGLLQRGAVVQVPGVGSQNFLDLLMQLATYQFIQQCRFNPQHNAESEQQLYNELPVWLSQAGEQSSNLLVEIKTGNSVHQAKLPGEGLARKLDVYYQKIAQQLSVLSGDDHCQILVSQRLAAYPGFLESLAGFGNIEIVAPQELADSCLAFHEHIKGDGGELRFVTGLPFVRKDSGTATRKNPGAEKQQDPTHLLYEDWALPLGRVEINNRPAVNGDAVVAGGVNLSVKGLPDYLGQIERRGDEVFLICGEAGAYLNNEKILGRRRLLRGDRLRFGERGKELCLIRVQNDEQTP